MRNDEKAQIRKRNKKSLTFNIKMRYNFNAYLSRIKI